MFPREEPLLSEFRLLREDALLSLLEDERLADTEDCDCVRGETLLLRCDDWLLLLCGLAVALLFALLRVAGCADVLARLVLDEARTVLFGVARDVLAGLLFETAFPPLPRVVGAAARSREAGCTPLFGRCVVVEAPRALVADLVSVAGLAARLVAWRASLLRLRGAVASLRDRSAVLAVADRVAVRTLLFADLTVAASEMRLGLADARVLRSTSGR